MADLHIGGWREPKMSSLTIVAFKQAIDECIEENVDFIMIAGDIFNTSLPNIDFIKETVKQLKRLKQNNIPVYIIPGSHDYSPSGKTMLEVLEHADMLINVVKAKQIEDNEGNKDNKNNENNKIQLIFTEDKKTGVKLTGMLGKKNMLEKSYYESIDQSLLESEQGFKIFLFHTAIDELKPEDLAKMDSSPISLLPKGFDYYAGGHVHIIENKSFEGYKNVIYPGPLFPNSFSELEKLKHGGYFIYNEGNIEYKAIKLKDTIFVEVDCLNLTPEQVELKLHEGFRDKDVGDKIILIRLKGKLKLGKLLDIDLKTIMHGLYEKGAYFVMKNTTAIASTDFTEVKKSFNPEILEQEVIDEHLGQTKIEGLDTDHEKSMILSLIGQLSKEKMEGETNATYEDRILKDVELLKD